MWWRMGHFDQSGDAAWKFSKRWLQEGPASPVTHKDNRLVDSFLEYFKWNHMIWFYYSGLKNIYTYNLRQKNWHILPVCLQRFSPSHSCLCRFELLPHCYLSHWVCRWFENHQRRLYADPKIRTAQHGLCEAGLMMTGTFQSMWTGKNKNVGVQLSERVVSPGSWWGCCWLGLCTRSCLPFPPGRFCLPQQTSASQRTCHWS